MIGQATVYILNNLMQFGLLNSENWGIEYRIASRTGLISLLYELSHVLPDCAEI